ncbi:isopentenyl diphosphate isomerase [Wallemia mellicola]|uniref:isopentenyl-diphosphate Delta-isomerase n=1 Tax=Wallemia mellicola TaxID=1708541 RepID=A0AB74KDQ1_9BASI|nr:isopentenyl diphosphate isomerase [Wallemia mellicola]TIC61954.1 isopentenyl diphosphate isomerase [Wallemia mellicola]
MVELSKDEYDLEQIRLMEERCILLDENDNVMGDVSKKDCHLMDNINKGMLHRAFSTFLFRPSDGSLLLQKRSKEKITFPDLWTNTCCSHPLAIKSELDGIPGAKNAAIRKLEHELGIKGLKPDQFDYLTRIHYLAPSDSLWGEHEIDYILFIKADVELDINPNEISESRYVNQQELKDMMNDKDQYKLTPWFELIGDELLFKWWDQLLKGEKLVQDDKLYRMI